MEVYAFHLMPYQEGTDDLAWPITADRFDPSVGRDHYDAYVSQLLYAAELGYDGLAFNEHHYRAFGLMPSPNLIAATVARPTEDVDIAIYGNVLPLRENPVRLAEELAMLDVLSDGRLVSGFVRGLPNEYRAYGIDREDSRARFDEAWELIVRAWTEPDPFDFTGDHYTYEDVFIWPRPVQDPHPPLRRPAESEASLRHAVDNRTPISRAFCSTAEARDTFERYRSIAREAGWSPGDAHTELTRLIYVGATDERAREEAEPHVEYFHRKLLISAFRTAAVYEAGDERYRPAHAEEYERNLQSALEPFGDQWVRASYDELQETGEIIVGGPETVATEIEAQYDAVGGFGTLLHLFQFGTLPDELARRSLERFAEEVQPAIASLGE